MVSRKERLQSLVKVQRQLKAYHEMRHATFLADAQSAGAEAAEMMERAEAPSSLAALFPDVYARGIGNALRRQTVSTEKAKTEAAIVATETARTNMVEQAYKEARLLEEREKADRERLEALQRRKPAL